MRCVKCGQELPDDANFCRRCGSPTIRNMSYLVQKARENDQEALAEIYKISSPAVYKTIRVLIKDEDTVYDILQDTYVKAFTRLDQLQNPDKLIPWLKMIANNLAKDWLKKSKPTTSRSTCPKAGLSRSPCSRPTAPSSPLLRTPPTNRC